MYNKTIVPDVPYYSVNVCASLQPFKAKEQPVSLVGGFFPNVSG